MAEWKRVKIGDVCTIEKGVTGLAKALPGDYPLVTTGAERKTSRDYQFDTKAVCIPLVSSTGHGKKTLNYVHYQEGKFALGSILSAVVPRDETILDARYLHVYLQKNKDRVLVPLMKGAANVSLSVTAISNIEVPLPSLVEQKKILGKIDSISNEHEDFLNESDVQIDLFGKLRQAVLQEAIEGKLTAEWRKQNHALISGDNHASKLLKKIKTEKERLVKKGKIKKDKPLPPIAENEKTFDLPEGWVWCRLGDICDFITKGTTPPTHELKREGDVPYLKVYNIVEQKIDFYYRPQFISFKVHEKLNRSKVYPGDVLMNIVGPPLGKVAIVPDSFSEWNINQALVIFRPVVDEISKFLYIYLFAGFEIKKIHTLGVVGQDNISLAQCRNIIFPLIPLTEQAEILRRVNELSVMVDELEKQVSERKGQAEMLMQSVLREAFAR